ncbi:MAG: amidohydrolase [Thermodesulfobacteriota bacterium]|nr:amidohydrolase [Thermodesulfobacteriota bacterium]
MNSADILVSNGIVLTLNTKNLQIKNGSVAIEKDKIVAVGNNDEFATWDVSKVIDATDCIIMPGLINTHTHAAMVAFRGLADDLPLMTWLNDYIFPAESKLDEDKVYHATLHACSEMIMSGTTCFCDMYLFEDAVARAAKRSGMRAVVGEVLYDFPSPNYGPIENGFAYSEMLIEKWKNDPLIKIAVEPHSPYLCSPDLLEKAFSIARAHDLCLVIHAAETESEVKKIKDKYGLTPIGHLADLGVLAPNLLACHCVVLTDDDICLLQQFDVKVAHNPESNMKLASGIAPIPRLLKEGICVGLGTDGCASNNNLDLFQEMDTAAKLHKVNTFDPTVLDSTTTLRMCTIEAARALGLEEITGSLEVGKKADIIILDTKKPHLTPMYNPASHLVYSAKGSDVKTTIINGEVVMEDGRLITLDLENTMDQIRKIAESIRK